MSVAAMAWAMHERGGACAMVAPKLAKSKRKPGVFRSEDLRRLVASLPCVHPGCAKASQAAHGNETKGMGFKASDARVMALCPDHHHAIDGGNKALKQAERRAIENAYMVATYAELFKRGLLVPAVTEAA